MRVDELFPPEVIDEDIKKWMGGALGAAALAGAAFAPGTPNINEPARHVSAPDPYVKDLTALAQTMWGEARSHGPMGMLAVGYVIKNRAQSGEAAQEKFKFGGHDVASVAMMPKQFSCWNKSDPNHVEMEGMRQIDNIIRTKKAPDGETYQDWMSKFKTSPAFNDYKAWKEAFAIAKDILAGKTKDPTNGAVFYHTTHVHPKWAHHMKPCSKVASHVFYKIPQKSTSA